MKQKAGIAGFSLYDLTFAMTRTSKRAKPRLRSVAVDRVVGHQASCHIGFPDAWLEKNVITCPAGSWTVKTS